ncbi:MAG: 16S rRNA (cytosine(1402)-N(4))-methyltransferase RsmH [Defluviitaleaceae bacterium]|nr:16S rRNA (cytosine(1402)-N(4))-methyltransferase RsmH [Defluviitaleaceae bacterium]
MTDFAHVPVLLNEAVDALKIKPNGVYVDCTLGGGGHSAEICARLAGDLSGRVIGIDRDENAIEAASARIKSKNFFAVHGNFHDLKTILRECGPERADGILMDLGVSSHQIDTAERGFSFRADGPLDMRMAAKPLSAEGASRKAIHSLEDGRVCEFFTARDIVNNFSEAELAKIFFEFGEERFSRRIAKKICVAREISPIETTLALAKIIEAAVPQKRGAKQPHPAMRTFMALRIAVNDELTPLDAAVRDAVDMLAVGGRIAVITFHSLEDRIVKQNFAKLASPCECPRDIPYCACGKIPSLRVVTRKPVLPSPEEISHNSRAHSAKLRVGERI